MSWGGHRIGSGRKPGENKPQLVKRRGQVEMASAADPVPVPYSLAPDVRAVWERWAPHAEAQRTLTPATAAGFHQLCEQSVFLSALGALIRELGPAHPEAQPYLQTYIKLAVRVDAQLARFKLTAFGKPAASEKPKAAANPWAGVAG